MIMSTRNSTMMERIMSQDSPLGLPRKGLKIKEGLGGASHLSFRPDQGLAVVDSLAKSVKILDEKGRVVKRVGDGAVPVAVAVNKSGSITVVERRSKKHSIVKTYSPDGDREISQWGDDNSWKPSGLVLTGRGQLGVSDCQAAKHPVQVYTMDGKSLFQMGSVVKDNANFLHSPLYLAVDVFDRIIVSDFAQHCIKIFDVRSHGGSVTTLGRPGHGPGELNHPRGVCCDSMGNIFVCDSGNKRVSVFFCDGRFKQHLLTRRDGLAHPYAIDYKQQTLALSQHSSAKDGSFRKIRTYELEPKL